MIIAQFEFPALAVHPVKGVEKVTLPYYERIVCSDYKVDVTSIEKDVTLHGAYRGEATIIFRLEHVKTFSFIDENTEATFEKWRRHYLTKDRFTWVHDPMTIDEKEIFQC